MLAWVAGAAAQSANTDLASAAARGSQGMASRRGRRGRGRVMIVRPGSGPVAPGDAGQGGSAPRGQAGFAGAQAPPGDVDLGVVGPQHLPGRAPGAGADLRLVALPEGRGLAVR